MSVIIQGLWIGDILSRFEYNSIKSYVNLEYTYHLYTYSKVENIPEGVIIKDANEILHSSNIFYYEGSIAPFSDLFRYKLLYERGGVWTDCDIICLRRFPIHKEKYIFVAERTILKGAFSSCIKKPPYTCKEKKVLNSFIVAPKGSSLMLSMYEKSLKYRDEYLDLQKKKKNARTFTKSKVVKTLKINKKRNIGLKSFHWKGGSKTLENEINILHLEKYIMSAEFAFPVNWWDFKYVFKDIQIIPPSKGWTEETNVNDIINSSNSNKKTYLIVIHNGWIKNKGYDKNAKYPVNSLFEKLDRYINTI